MVGEDFFGITSRRPGSLIIGNFVPKFSLSVFENSLTHSNRRRSNARLEPFSIRNKNHSAVPGVVGESYDDQLYSSTKFA
jgi:hypothetical protein